jgi:glucokinase
VIRAAGGGSDGARRALRQYAEYLAIGIASIVHLLDPEMVILAGGITQRNDILLRDLDELLPRLVMAAEMRRLRVCVSRLGYYGAVYGAGVMARELIKQRF